MFTFEDLRRVTTTVLVAASVSALGISSSMAQAPTASRAAPNALLSIDQNRGTVVDRIVADWSDAFAKSNAGIDAGQLRTLLLGMRADHLLAASLAGTLDGLRQVIAGSLASQEATSDKSRVAPKSLGDTADDVVYTPVTPCRIIDTRNAVGALQINEIRTEDGFNAASFAAQGGAASNCGIPNGVSALTLNVVAVQPSGLGHLTLWPANAAEPNASTINFDPTTITIANGTIVPVDSANNNRFNVKSVAHVDLVADVLGYFAPPVATAVQCTSIASSGTTIAVSSDVTVAFPSCASGYTRTSGTCSGTSGIPSGYLVETNGTGCVFRNLSAVATYSATATSTCCRIPGR